MAGIEMKADEVTGLLDSVMASFNKQQGLEQADKLDAERATQSIKQSAGVYQQVVQQTSAETTKLLAKQQDARRLADGGLGDVMELMFKQTFDKDYTQEGRDQTQNAISTKATVAADMHNASVAAETARLDAAKARRATDIYNTEAQMQSLKVRVETMGTVAQGVQASELLRQQNMSTLDITAIDEAMGSETIAADGKVQIGGFTYTGRELKGRRKELEMTDFINAIPADLAAPGYSAFITEKNRILLGNMTSAELSALEANGSVMADGSQADPFAVRAAKAERNIIDQQEATQSMADTLGEAQMPAVMQSVHTQFDHLTQVIKPNSPLYTDFVNSRIEVASILENQAAMAKIPGGSALLAKQLGEAQVRLEGKIEQQALSMAGGDKDLMPIKRAEILGIPADPRLVTDYAVAAYRDGRSFSAAFPAAESAKVQAEISASFNAIMAESKRGSVFVNEKPSEVEMKEIREQAARQGITSYGAKQAIVAANFLPRIALTTRTDNPLTVAGITPEQYSAIEAEAARIGENAILSGKMTAGGDPLPADTFAQIEAGKHKVLGISDEQADQLNAERNIMATQYEYDLLESVSPGVGQAYATWLSANQAQLYDTVLQHPDLASTSGLFRDQFVKIAQSSSTLWSSAAENATGRGEQVMKQMMVKAYVPEKMYTNVFNMIDSVEDDAKTQVLNRIVMPLLAQGAERRLGREEISASISNALTVGIEGEPALNKQALRVLRSLPAAMGQYEMIVNLLTDNKGHIGKEDAAQIRGMLGPQSGKVTPDQLLAGQQQVGGPPIGYTPSFAPRPQLAGNARQQMENNPGGVAAAIDRLRNGQ